MIIPNKIPYEFFITSGVGESDLAIHAGSYHMALADAGIEKFNIMTYSSILPAQAKLIERPKEFNPSAIHQDKLLEFGSVMDCIMSVAHGTKGDHIQAGIIYGWLYHYDEKINNEKKIGGIVCEYSTNEDKDIEPILRGLLQEIYDRSFQGYILKDVSIIKKDLEVTKKYGTALVALCFTSYIVMPLLS